jgi:hypothetical protein
MRPAPGDLSARLYASLDRLAARPLAVLGLLLLANALVLPYRGVSHDARLYGIQIVEKVSPGTFDQDLFLRYGSQDGYSIFTPLMVPLVRTLGLEAAFFLAYLVFKTLFLWALLRLVFLLVPDRVTALLALVALAMSPLSFGGNDVIRANESFLTPRIPGCALVLFALERTLSGRLLAAVLLLAGALAVHPLMGVTGVLVVLLWWLISHLSPRKLLALGAVVAVLGCAVVFYQPLGRRIFGYVDDEWRAVDLHICFFLQPKVWTAGDWVSVAVAAGVIGAALGYARRWSALLVALLVAAGMGLAGSLVASHWPYLLLIAVSPYRTLWLLELLAVPFGFWGCALLWRRGDGLARCAACALVLLLTTDWNCAPVAPAVVFLVLLPLCVVFHRGAGRAAHTPGWLADSGRSAFALCVLVLLAVDLYLLALGWLTPARFDLDVHPVLLLQGTGPVLYKLPLLLILVGAVGLLAQGMTWRLSAALLVGALAYQAALTGLDAAPWYHRRYSPRWRHTQFVADFLRGQSATREKPLSVYWSGDLRDTWYRANVLSYFHAAQLSGCAFNRGTALEGRRRGQLVRRFEVEALRRAPIMEPWWQRAYEGFYDVPEGECTPTEDDLRALCAEPELDFVVLEDRFPGLYCAGDGRYFIYDCRQVRASSRTPPGKPATARAFKPFSDSP